MQTETSRGPLTGPEGDGPVPAGGPRWRALLEMRWRARLQEVTELALAYHEAAAAAGRRGAGGSGAGRSGAGGSGAGRSGDAGLQLQRLQRRTVTSRRALADTEEALARLSAGRYGRCESCAVAIPAQRLAAMPETRYCARCARGRGR